MRSGWRCQSPATPFYFCIFYEKRQGLLSKQERETEGKRWHSGIWGEENREGREYEGRIYWIG